MFLLGESAPWGIRRVWERFLFDGGKGREILRGACLEAGSAQGRLVPRTLSRSRQRPARSVRGGSAPFVGGCNFVRLTMTIQHVIDMETTTHDGITIKMMLPEASDLHLLRELAARMGWVIERERRTDLDEAIDDIKAGRVHKAKDVDDLMEQLMK